MPSEAGGEACLYLLLTGCVTSENSSGSAVSVFWPGDLVVPEPAARAACEITCLQFSQSALLAEMSRNSELSAWVWREHLKRIEELRRRIGMLNGASVEQRIMQTVAELGQRANEAGTSGVVPLAQKEVAELAGATRETTSTLLNKMRRLGIVALRRRRIIVNEPERLKGLDSLEEPRSSEVTSEINSLSVAAGAI